MWRCWALFFLVVLKQSSWGQNLILSTDSFLVYDFENSNNLVQYPVNSICKDNNGFVWVATENGLSKWNGNYFTDYTETSDKKNKITRVACVLQSKINNNTYFIDRFEEAYKLNDDNKLVTTHFNYFRDIIKGDSLLIKTGEILANQHGFLHDISMVKNGFVSPTNTSVCVYNQQLGKATFTKFNRQLSQYLFINDTAFLFFEKNECLTISPQGQKAVKLNLVIDGKENNAVFNQSFAFIQSNNKATRCFIDGRVYSVTKSGRNLFLHFLYNINSLFVTSFYYDPDTKTEYLGTVDKGLLMVKPRYFKELRPTKSKVAELYYSQLQLKNGLILCAGYPSQKTEGNRVNHVYTPQGKVWVDKKTENIPPPNLVFKSSRGITYMATAASTNSLFRLDESTYQTKVLHTSKYIYKCMAEDPISGMLYIALSNEIIAYHPQQNKFRRLCGSDTIKLKNNFISIFFLNDGNLLCGTENGLFELNLKTLKQHFIPEFDNCTVRNICADKNNKDLILIGTYGNGMYARYKHSYVKLPGDQNGYLNFAHCFAKDRQNRYWIPTNHGLFMLPYSNLISYLNGESSTLMYTSFDKTDGLASNEFNGGCQPAYVEMEDGRFSFPGMNGLVWFNPNNIKSSNKKYPIVIESVQCDGRELKPDSLLLPPDFVFLTINTNQAFYGKAQNKLTVYQLKNLSEEKKPIAANGKIEFNNLPAGKYVLLIESTNLQGAIDVYKLPFKVKRYWYQTVYFYLSCIFLLVTAVLFFIKLRTRLHILQKQKLEKRIAVKTRFLKNKNEELEKMYHNQDVLISVLTHDISSPIKFITNINSNLLKHWNTISEAEKLVLLDESGSNLKFIYQYMDNTLLWINSKKRKNINLQLINFNELAQFANAYFTICEKNNNRFSFILKNTEGVKFYSEQRILFVILNNLISNANKYTHNGLVELTIEKQEENISITCKDTGVGISQENIKHILLKNTESINELKNSYKLGYIFIIDLLSLIQGTLAIESQPGKGTLVIIKIPLKTEI